MDMRLFSDENLAREYMEKLRWPNGAICVFCNAEGAYRLARRIESKSPVRPGVHKCKKCRKQFTVKVGTIFEDSHIPLHKWLHAIYLMSTSRKGVSSNQLHRMLGITYKSAWFMTHRIRYSMKQEAIQNFFTLKGAVQVDEAYIGGRQKGFKVGRGTTNKTPVSVLVERNGKARLKVIGKASRQELHDRIKMYVDKNATIMTDEWPSYRGIGKFFKGGHKTVNHSKHEYARGGVTTNTAESFFALFKRGLHGTFHFVSKQHLDRYCDEFAFRWNNRRDTDETTMAKTIRNAEGARLFYKDVA
jgi:transposase-like protein